MNNKLLYGLVILFVLCVNCGCLSLRDLYDDSTRKEICKKAGKYNDPKEMSSLNNYVESLGDGGEAGKKFIEGILTTGSMDGLVDFVMELIVYLVFIVLGVIFVISWFPLLCCCCCSCCVFKKNVKSGLCGFVAYIVASALFLIVVICSAVGLAKTSQFSKDFNGSSCALMNFFEHAINGEDTNEFPKWGGMNHISTALGETQQALSSFPNPSPNPGTVPDDIEDVCYSESGNDYFKTEDMTVLQLSRSQYSELSPKLVKEFDQSYTTDTMIDKIKTEYLTYIEGGRAQVVQLENNEEVLGKDTFSSSLGEIQTKFSSIGSMLESASESLATNFVDLQIKFSDYILLGFNVIFGVFLAISVITLVSLSLYVWMKIFPLKYVIHIMWNLSMFLLFLGLIIGSVLGIVSSVSRQLSPVMGYLLSPEYLEKPDSVISAGGETGNMLDICLNQDGNLSETMNVGENEDQFDQYYNASSYLEKIYENLTISKMEAIQAAKVYINDLYANVGSMQVTDDKTLSEYLKDDFNDDCNPTLQITSIESFPSNCNSYSGSCKTKCEEFVKLKNDITQIHTQLNENFVSKFSTTLTCLQGRIGGKIDTIEGINSALNPILGGEGSFLSLFNCNFIKEDIIRFCDRFSNHFYHSTFNMFLCCTLIGLCSYIGVYFLLPAMYRYSQEARAPETELEAPAEQEPEPEKKEVTPADGGDSASVKPMIYSQVDVDSKVI